jgi:tetratricopeptide (TPR) repeat protein
MAHTLLVRVHTFYTHDWAAAQREVSIALSIRPNDWAALFAAGDVAMATGMLEEAERLFKKALLVDPLSADTHFEMSQVLMGMGKLAEAEAEARRGLLIIPTYSSGHAELGTILLAQHRFEESAREFDQETFQGWRLPGLSQAYHALGHASASRAALDQAIGSYASNQNQVFEIACAFAYLGQNDNAFKWLDNAIRLSDSYLVYFYVSWQLRSLTSDPRYKAFLHKMNLPG